MVILVLFEVVFVICFSCAVIFAANWSGMGPSTFEST